MAQQRPATPIDAQQLHPVLVDGRYRIWDLGLEYLERICLSIALLSPV